MGQFNSVYVRLCQDSSGYLRLGQFTQVFSVRFLLYQVNSGYVRLGQFMSG